MDYTEQKKLNSIIMDKIIEIPLANWNGYKVTLNGLEIVLHTAHTNYSPWIQIGDAKIYEERVSKLRWALDEEHNRKEVAKNIKLK